MKFEDIYRTWKNLRIKCPNKDKKDIRFCGLHQKTDIECKLRNCTMDFNHNQ